MSSKEKKIVLMFEDCYNKLYMAPSLRFYCSMTPNFHTSAHYILQQTVLAFIKLFFTSADLELVL